MPIASLIIPTYNGARRVPDVLSALCRQAPSLGHDVEVIVVDNASKDDTARCVADDVNWRQLVARGVICRIVHEPKPGLTHARIAGVLAASAPAICFLDDDNLPEPPYVAAGIAAMAGPQVGVLTSRVLPRYQVTPSPSIVKREHLLALNYRLGETRFRFGPDWFLVPTLGAGMWLRRQAFLDVIPWRNPNLLISDRAGGLLTGGGDIEIGILLRRAGYELWYEPSLRIHHLIPPGRLETRYICRLIVGTIRSEKSLSARYGKSESWTQKLKSLGGFVSACLVAPAIMIFRPDGLREAAFVIAGRWAKLRGPL